MKAPVQLTGGSGFRFENSVAARFLLDMLWQFRRGADAIILVVGDLANDVQKAWSYLFKQAQALQSTPERLVTRLVPDTNQGSQSSALQRTIFESLHRPDELRVENRDDLSDRALLIHDIRALNLDYDAQSSSDHGQALLDCQSALSSGDASEAIKLWERLVGIADELRPLGASLDLPGLLAILRGQFQLLDYPDFRADWGILRRRSGDAIANINIKISGTAQLDRSDQRAKIAALLAAKRTCILVGELGSGKSALAKQLSTESYARSVWLSDSDIDHKTALDFERAIGVRHPLSQILFASPESCLVIFDGLEGYSADALHTATIIKELFSNPAADHVHVLLTVQPEAAARLMRDFVRLGVPDGALNTTTLDRPSDDELNTLLAELPKLNWITLRPEIRPLLANLKVLDLTAQTLHSDKALGDRPLVD
jgi:hypothetical protein